MGSYADVRVSARERGFSVMETFIVVLILAVMLMVALPQFLTYRSSYSTDGVAAQVVDVLRYANQQALGERQRMRVEITPGTADAAGKIEVYDEETIGGGAGDDELLRVEVLPDGNEISFAQPEEIEPPASPFNFEAAKFTDGTFVIYFNPVGSASGADVEVPLSTTIFVAPAGVEKGAPNQDLVRAVTVFGPTASTRLWGYDPRADAFQVR